MIERGASDDRNFVKKGVSWALRHLGHRNAALHAAAVKTATKLSKSEHATERWVGKDALRDLTRPIGHCQGARRSADQRSSYQ